MHSGTKIFLAVCAMGFAALIGSNHASAAPCPTGGTKTISSSCEINGTANYTDLTITGGAVVTSDLGQKMQITATGKVTIDAGSGIDVTGKGNDPAGKGGDAICSSNCGTGASAKAGSGGGGGGHGAVGGPGGSDWTSTGGAGGAMHGLDTNPTDLGSAGGNGNEAAAGGGYGAYGGGAVIINAPTVILNGYIYANGLKGGLGGPAGGGSCGGSGSSDGTGGGGGGSGGSVNIQTVTFDFNGNIQANGGDGGNDANTSGSDGTGGGGAGGRVYVYYTERTGSGTMSANGGLAGTLSVCGGVPGGAGGGSVGSMINPCTMGVLVCADRCVDATTREYGGTCDIYTGKCTYSGTASCIDSDDCTLDACTDGACGSANLCGGLVPCGRLGNNPDTSEIDESKPCDLCAAMYMIKKTVNFAMGLAVGVGVLIMVIAGLLYATSAGDMRKIEIAKSAVTYALLGIFIMFIAWLIIAAVLQAMGYAGIGVWNQVNCTLQT